MHRWTLYEPERWVRARDGVERRRVTVTLAADRRDERAELEWSGDPELVEQAESRLLAAAGHGGHGMSSWTTPLDLACAMAGPMMAAFAPELVLGGFGRRSPRGHSGVR